MNCDIPEWLGVRITELERAIQALRQDQIEMRLRKAKVLRSTLKTIKERRTDAEKEIEKLEKLKNA